jgi:hypothetical protein
MRAAHPYDAERVGLDGLTRRIVRDRHDGVIGPWVDRTRF